MDEELVQQRSLYTEDYDQGGAWDQKKFMKRRNLDNSQEIILILSTHLFSALAKKQLAQHYCVESKRG